MRIRMFSVLLAIAFSLIALRVDAQGFRVVKGECTPDLAHDGSLRASGARRLPSIRADWNPNKTYKQMVILVNFSDVKFNMEDPREYYDNLFNQPGYTERKGIGSVADYFRAQSGGRLNLSFDIYGPIEVSSKAQPYDNPTENTRNYGTSVLREAAQKVINQNYATDFSEYDWNGDKTIEQVVYVYAGYGGNQGEAYGYIWPNTSSFGTLSTADGHTISNYTCSAERWYTGRESYYSFSIGTICHEFSHSLGLPDVYRTNVSNNIVMDTWDLMDGGNMVNYGCLPPNYTPLEKKLLGWVEVEELKAPASIADLEYGKVYRISTNDENDYYLLENRQQVGWDGGAPGQGLCIYHVKWNSNAWSSNAINNNDTRYDLVHADGLDYYQWEAKVGNESIWASSGMRNNKLLSTSPFPYGEVNSFTEVADKAVTNIVMADDGKISFDFMGGATAVDAIRRVPSGERQMFDLAGRRVDTMQAGQLYVIREADGTIHKQFIR